MYHFACDMYYRFGRDDFISKTFKKASLKFRVFVKQQFRSDDLSILLYMDNLANAAFENSIGRHLEAIDFVENVVNECGMNFRPNKSPMDYLNGLHFYQMGLALDGLIRKEKARKHFYIAFSCLNEFVKKDFMKMPYLCDIVYGKIFYKPCFYHYV